MLPRRVSGQLPLAIIPSFRTKAALKAELEALRKQVAVLRHRRAPRLGLNIVGRRVRIWSHRLSLGCLSSLVNVKPALAMHSHRAVCALVDARDRESEAAGAPLAREATRGYSLISAARAFLALGILLNGFRCEVRGTATGKQVQGVLVYDRPCPCFRNGAGGSIGDLGLRGVKGAHGEYANDHEGEQQGLKP